MALRRFGVLVVLSGTIALAWVLLSATARTASATAVCSQFDVTGRWTFSIFPSLNYVVDFQQDSAGQVTGELFYSPAEVAGFGYPPGTRFPITKGLIIGDQLTFEDTPTQPKTDGTGAHVGVYNGLVTRELGSITGKINGNAHDKQVPSSHFVFVGDGPAKCLATEPGAPAVAPSPSGFGVPAPVQAKPGSDTVVSGPPLGNATKASATANGVTAHDALVADLVLRVGLAGKLKRVCLTAFARSLHGKVIQTDLLGKLDAAYADLASCLALADAIDAYINAHVSTADQARISPCAQVQITVSLHGARRRTVHVTHVGAIPNEPVTATCTFSRGRATITLRSNKRGTPLSKLIGPRLRIGLLRSRLDPPGGHPTVRFARR